MEQKSDNDVYVIKIINRYDFTASILTSICLSVDDIGHDAEGDMLCALIHLKTWRYISCLLTYLLTYLNIAAGVKVMFRIALVLFKHVLGRPDQLVECPSMYETMEKLRIIPAMYMEEEFLVQEVSVPFCVGIYNVHL